MNKKVYKNYTLQYCYVEIPSELRNGLVAKKCKGYYYVDKRLIYNQPSIHLGIRYFIN